MLLKKNMSRFLYIFAFGTLLSVSYISGVGSAPAKKFIIDEFRNGICPTSSFLYNSSYMSNCTKIEYPSEPFNISEDNSNKFLCLGLYDISYRICYFESRNRNSISLTNYENDLDLQLKKVVQSSNTPSQFCEQQQSWKYSPLYNKTQRAVSTLTIAFKDDFECQRICFNFNKEINLLCAIWVWATHLPISEISTLDQQNSNNLGLTSSSKTKSDTNDQTSHNMSSATVNISVTQSEFIKNEKNKQNKTLPFGKENDSEASVNDYKPKTPPKDNGKVQASRTSLSGAVQHHPDSEIETKSSNGDKIYESSNPKPESPIDANKKFEGLENSAGSTTDEKNIDPSQKMGATGANISQAATVLQNAHDQKNVNSEDLSEDHSYGISYTTEDSAGVVQDLGTSGPSLPKPSEIKNTDLQDSSIRTEDDSHVFTYFVVITLLCIGGYVGYHNKQKILAIVLEGRRSRGNRGRRRPNTASYRKLDCTLEEAVNSQCNSNVTHVIY